MAEPLKNRVGETFIRAVARSLAGVLPTSPCPPEVPADGCSAAGSHMPQDGGAPPAQQCAQSTGTEPTPNRQQPDGPALPELTAAHDGHVCFDCQGFTSFLLDGTWEDREIMDRIHRIAEGFERFLHGSVPARLAALRAIHAHHPGMAHLAFPAYVERYGLEHWDESLAALEAFTPVSSAEFAVRPFIRADQPRMMARMLSWAAHENEHLRRLASEGCRPRLPWASPLRRFIADPAPVLPVLHALRDDPSEYVRRSVANNLNDISKDHPRLALDICEDWHGRSPRTDRLIKHALRTLLKAGNTRALALHGFGDPAGVSIRKLAMRPATIHIGTRGEFAFQLVVPKGSDRKLRLEYVIHFAKKNGTLSPKVFQLREADFAPGTHCFAKEHAFADLTTRKHHSGPHALAIHVNGRELARQAFRLS